MRLQFGLTFTGLAVLSVTGCTLNQSGNTSASKTGDLSNPAERRSPIEALRAACGSGEPTTAGELQIKRRPYLQQVTTSSALVGWVATQQDARVDVTLPDGTLVSSGVAELEYTAVRTEGEHQLWARLDGLAPDTTYCYTLADSSGPLTAATGFRTAPTADDPDPIRFLAFGDSGGGGSDQYALLDQMFTVPYDLIVHTGDVAYDDGTIGQFEDNVFGVYHELFRNLPFFPAAGNHDYNTLQGAPFRDVFALPGDGGEKWFSYDWGRIHFAAIDTESDYATQAAWLEQDLAASTLPWKIVYMHHPMYSSGVHGSDLALRDQLVPILERYGVQLVLSGHDHHYERIKPQGGIAHVLTGGGGRGTRSVGSSTFTALADEVIHFVALDVGADELVMHAIDAAGKEFDSMVVTR